MQHFLDVTVGGRLNSSSTSTPVRAGRAALVVGHCGHELLVHGWLERAQPRVFVLTDGSGRAEASRLDSTARVVEGAGARPGCIFGRFTDADAYAAMLARDAGFFTGLADELCGELVRNEVEVVIADALEGYNPTHDMCRFVVDAAVVMAGRATNCPVASYDFLLAGPPGLPPEAPAPGAMVVGLDDDAFRRKLARAREYPGLASTVDGVLEAWGADALRHEYLRPVEAGRDPDEDFAGAPYYERYGERQVAAGYYPHVVRYREHIRPLFDALRRHSEERHLWPACAS